MKKNILLIILIFLSSYSFAQKTWKGGTSSDWNLAANWDGGIMPAAGDDIYLKTSGFDPIFPAGVGPGYNLIKAYKPSKLTISNAYLGNIPKVIINNGATLTVDAGESINITTQLTNYGTINNNGTITSNKTYNKFSNAQFNLNLGAKFICKKIYNQAGAHMTVLGGAEIDNSSAGAGLYTNEASTLTLKDGAILKSDLFENMADAGTDLIFPTGGNVVITGELKNHSDFLIFPPNSTITITEGITNTDGAWLQLQDNSIIRTDPTGADKSKVVLTNELGGEATTPSGKSCTIDGRFFNFGKFFISSNSTMNVSGTSFSENKTGAKIYLFSNSKLELAKYLVNRGTVTLYDNSILKTPQITEYPSGDITFNTAGITATLDANLYVHGDELVFPEGTFNITKLRIDNLTVPGKVTLNPLAKMTVSSTFRLDEVDNEFRLQSDATGTATLKNGNTWGTINGKIFVERYFNTTANQWRLVASPLDADVAEIFKGHFLSEWNIGTGDFDPITDVTTDLNLGEGYVTKLDFLGADGVPDKPNPIVYKDGIIKRNEFSTTLNPTMEEGATGLSNTYFNLPVGFHLIGNPYPINIDWTAIYNYDTNGANISKYLYYYVEGGAVSDPDHVPAAKNGWQVFDGSIPDATKQYIQIGQGFGVVMADNTSAKTFKIPLNSRTHSGSTIFSKKGNTETRTSFTLNSVSKNIIDEIKLRFNESATDNYDVAYDAFKLKPFTTSPTASFISADGQTLAVSEMPTTELVDLGFTMDENGEVVFSVADVVGFSEIILEDTNNGTFTNLLEDNYTFNYTSGEAERGRFKLHLNRQALSEPGDISNYLQVYSYNGVLYLKSSETLNNVDVTLYNINGQEVLKQNMNVLKEKEINTDLTKGVYLLKVRSDKGSSTQKITL